jgi:hypothetical protein
MVAGFDGPSVLDGFTIGLAEISFTWIPMEFSSTGNERGWIWRVILNVSFMLSYGIASFPKEEENSIFHGDSEPRLLIGFSATPILQAIANLVYPKDKYSRF